MWLCVFLSVEVATYRLNSHKGGKIAPINVIEKKAKIGFVFGYAIKIF